MWQFARLLGRLCSNSSSETVEKLNSKIHCLDQEGIQQFVFLGLLTREQQEKFKYLAVGHCYTVGSEV